LTVEVVAVRWSCFVCEATVITPPDALPRDWLELEPPTWRAWHPPRHYCPDHAAEGRALRKARRAKYPDWLQVDRDEYERTRAALRHALARLDGLRFTAD